MVGSVDRGDPSSRLIQSPFARGADNQPDGKKECQTCKNRKYVDGSNEPGVSFKAPTHVSPENASALVTAHEYEHVTNAQGEAFEKDRKIVSQTVQIQVSCCPECGKIFVSGGKTSTVSASREKTDYSQLMGKGRNVDRRA